METLTVGSLMSKRIFLITIALMVWSVTVLASSAEYNGYITGFGKSQNGMWIDVRMTRLYYLSRDQYGSSNKPGDVVRMEAMPTSCLVVEGRVVNYETFCSALKAGMYAANINEGFWAISSLPEEIDGKIKSVGNSSVSIEEELINATHFKQQTYKTVDVPTSGSEIYYKRELSTVSVGLKTGRSCRVIQPRPQMIYAWSSAAFNPAPAPNSNRPWQSDYIVRSVGTLAQFVNKRYPFQTSPLGVNASRDTILNGSNGNAFCGMRWRNFGDWLGTISPNEWMAIGGKYSSPEIFMSNSFDPYRFEGEVTSYNAGASSLTIRLLSGNSAGDSRTVNIAGDAKFILDGISSTKTAVCATGNYIRFYNSAPKMLIVDEAVNQIAGEYPQALFSVSKSEWAIPFDVAFDASGSSSPSASALTYSWDFGDGNTAQGLKVSHTYNKAGTFVSKLTVTDGNGLSTEWREAILAYDPPLIRSVAGTNLQPGLKRWSQIQNGGATFEGQAKLTPTAEDVVPDFAIRDQPNGIYSAVIAGYILVPETGIYRFGMVNDWHHDASLKVGNYVVIKDIYRTVRTSNYQVYGIAYLEKGYAPIAVAYNHGHWASALNVYWNSENLAHASINSSLLFHNPGDTREMVISISPTSIIPSQENKFAQYQNDPVSFLKTNNSNSVKLFDLTGRYIGKSLTGKIPTTSLGSGVYLTGREPIPQKLLHK